MNETEVIEKSILWIEQGRKIALATVISTWGSSPRGIGSQLVVDEKGAFEGSVSGGCVESTIITEAQYAIKDGKPQILTLGVSNDMAWDAGLACGGSIEVFLESATSNLALWRLVSEHRKANRSICLISRMDNGGKWLFDKEGVAQGCVEEISSELSVAACEVLGCGVSKRIEVDGIPYFLHGIFPDPQMIIVGAVHIAQPLASLAFLAGYNVKIIDPREAFATVERFPSTELIALWPEKAMAGLEFHSQTALVALSHTPRLDDPALMAALDSDAFYIGALGSKTTHGRRLERLMAAGYPSSSLERIHGPVGLRIGSKTPFEIALSIMAEITKVRRGIRKRRDNENLVGLPTFQKPVSALEPMRTGSACGMVS